MSYIIITNNKKVKRDIHNSYYAILNEYMQAIRYMADDDIDIYSKNTVTREDGKHIEFRDGNHKIVLSLPSDFAGNCYEELEKALKATKV